MNREMRERFLVPIICPEISFNYHREILFELDFSHSVNEILSHSSVSCKIVFALAAVCRCGRWRCGLDCNFRPSFAFYGRAEDFWIKILFRGKLINLLIEVDDGVGAVGVVLQWFICRLSTISSFWVNFQSFLAYSGPLRVNKQQVSKFIHLIVTHLPNLPSTEQIVNKNLFPKFSR